LSADAKIAGLTRYRKKGEAGEPLREMNLLEGLGVEGDFHQGGEKQVSLLSAEARQWIDAQTEQAKKGLCFVRFRENILIEGLPEDLESGSLLRAGDAVLRISERGKRCHGECSLFSKGLPCRLSASAVFATVERGGIIRITDVISIDKTIF